MEAASINSGGGEVRRVNVIYFLSRDGRVEHPHLLQIHRFRRGRVYLRDVKRWLAEVRGKEMPESFSWSYKRRHRGGYIWQDLTENGLITPFADNEYVLKGSELLPISTPEKEEEEKKYDYEQSALSPVDEKTPKTKRAAAAAAEDAAEVAAGAETLTVPPRDEQISPKPPPPEIDGGEYSSGTLDELLCREMAMVLKEEEQDKRGAYFVHGSGNNNINASNSKKNNKNRAKWMLYNILGCRSPPQTSDDALRPTSPQQEPGGDGSGGGREGDANLRTGEMSGSTGCGGNKWRKAGKQESEQPAAVATCSQCGKAFKPPKLHSHMQSCEGLARRGTGR